jgi:hypothetical protein
MLALPQVTARQQRHMRSAGIQRRQRQRRGGGPTSKDGNGCFVQTSCLYIACVWTVKPAAEWPISGSQALWHWRWRLEAACEHNLSRDE